jgi:hypothetical protein
MFPISLAALLYLHSSAASELVLPSPPFSHPISWTEVHVILGCEMLDITHPIIELNSHWMTLAVDLGQSLIIQPTSTVKE